MRVHTKKPRISSSKKTVLVLIQNEKQEHRFKIPLAKVSNWIRTLKDEGVLIRESANDRKRALSASEVFQDLDSKYTKPGVALRGARGKEGMSQSELAKRLGIPQGNLSKMENGKRPIGKAMAKRLSEVLNIDYRVFL
jgi:ribosome-binding protein aMBF1 (putative translation factor)